MHLENIVVNGSIESGLYTQMENVKNNAKQGSVIWYTKSDQLTQLAINAKSNLNYAIVTLAEFEKETEKLFPSAYIFTADKIKGLQFNNIIAYRLFDSIHNKAMFSVVNSQIEINKQNEIKANKADREASIDPIFKIIFTVFTRAIDNLYIFQDKRNNLKHIIEFINPTVLERTEIETPENSNYAQETISYEQQITTLKHFINNGHTQQAQLLFAQLKKNFNIEKDFNAYAQQLQNDKVKMNNQANKNSNSQPISIKNNTLLSQRKDFKNHNQPSSTLKKIKVTKIKNDLKSSSHTKDSTSTIEQKEKKSLQITHRIEATYNFEQYVSLQYKLANATSIRNLFIHPHLIIVLFATPIKEGEKILHQNLLTYFIKNEMMRPVFISEFKQHIMKVDMCHILPHLIENKVINDSLLEIITFILTHAKLDHLYKEINLLVSLYKMKAFHSILKNMSSDKILALMIYSIEQKNYLMLDEIVNVQHLNLNNATLFTTPPLCYAVEQAAILSVKVLLKIIKKPESTNTDGYNPFCLAIKCGHVEIVEFLLNQNALQWPSLHDPLFLAACHNRLEILKLLLTKVANKTIAPAILHIAIDQEFKDIIQFLLTDSRVEINALDKFNVTALERALFKSAEIVELLLDHNADANVKNKDGLYLLHMAIDIEDLAIIRLILANTTNPNIVITKENLALTPLHLAVMKEDINIITLLLSDKRVDALLQEPNDHLNPLQLAIKIGSLIIVEYFLKQPCYQTNIDDHRLLHFAVFYNHLPIIYFLLNHTKINVNALDTQGYTALHCAVFKNHIEAATLLLTKIDPNSIDIKKSQTALHLAVELNRTDIVKLLLKNKAVDVTFKNKFKHDPLAVACIYGRINIIDNLLQRIYEDKKLMLIDNFSLIVLATQHEQKEVLKKMLSTLPSHLNSYYTHAVFIAIVNNKTSILKYLIENNKKVLLTTTNLTINIIKQIMNVHHIPTTHFDHLSLDKAWSPLHLAILCQQAEIVKYLLAQECNIINQDKDSVISFVKLAELTENIEVINLIAQAKKTIFNQQHVITEYSISHYNQGLFNVNNINLINQIVENKADERVTHTKN